MTNPNGNITMDGAKKWSGYSVKPEDVCVIGIDTNDGPEHPAYDPRILNPLNEERILDFMRYGVRVPVLLRREKGRDKCVVVDGRGRVRHAREANKRLIEKGLPPLLLKATIEGEGTISNDDLAILGVMLNQHRDDDSLDVLAAKAKALLPRMGGSVEDVAVVFGWTPVYTQRVLDFNGVPDEVKAAVREGLIPASAALKLIHSSREEALDTLAQATANGTTKGSTKAVTEIVKAKAKGKGKKLTKKDRDGVEVVLTPRAAPGARNVRAVLLELERMDEEGRHKGVSDEALDEIAWALRWVLDGVEAPKAIRMAMANLDKRAAAAADEAAKPKKGKGKKTG